MLPLVHIYNPFICAVKKPYFHDLISCAEALLLSCTVLLNTSDENAHIVSSCQPHTHAVAFLETDHHCVRPGRSNRELYRTKEGKKNAH